MGQFSKKLKLSHFQQLAAGKQPSKSMPMQLVPEYSHIIVLSNVSSDIVFPLDNAMLSTCVQLQCSDVSVTVPCSSKLLRKTDKKGGESRLFKFTVERTPSLRDLSDVGQYNELRHVADTAQEYNFCCSKISTCPCSLVKFTQNDKETNSDCTDWVFGVRWTPEQFLEQAVKVGHPFANFSGCPRM